MREALFIVVVVLTLLGLTLLRYRKQIRGLIEVGKVLKDVKAATGPARVTGQPAGGKLVNCAKCGVWVPESKAIGKGAGRYFCSRECSTAKAR